MYNLKPDFYYIWSTKTLLLFCTISIFVLIVSNFGIIKLRINGKIYEMPIGLFSAVIILIGIKGFSAVGRDVLSGYYFGFMSASSLSDFTDDSVEIGYRLLAIFVHNIWNNYTFFLLVISFLTVVPVAYLAWKYRGYIDVGLTMFLYTTIYYFQGLSLLRIFLATSIGLLSMDYFFCNKYKKSLLYFILAISMHTSMLILLVPCLIYSYRKFSQGVYALLLGTVFLFVMLLGKQIIASFAGRYSVYSTLTSNGLGFEQLLYYLPILLLIYYGNKMGRTEKYTESVYRLGVSVLMVGFFLGEVAYIIPIFGRMQIAFISLIYFISFYVKELKLENLKLGTILKVLVIIYGLIRMYIYLKQYYNVDSIMPYTTIWGWTF